MKIITGVFAALLLSACTVNVGQPDEAQTSSASEPTNEDQFLSEMRNAGLDEYTSDADLVDAGLLACEMIDEGNLDTLVETLLVEYGPEQVAVFVVSSGTYFCPENVEKIKDYASSGALV